MFAYKAQLEAHFEELAALITRENGKTLEEARGDVRRGIEVVEFACGISHLAKGEALPQVAEHLDGVTLREPLGVCVGITPFNFPAMVPLWMFPLAIACGNTFVLKPSEKVPLTAVRLAELALEAGIPPGVLEHRPRRARSRRCACSCIRRSPRSASSARRASPSTSIRPACRHGKRVQAAGGAKNVMVVMPDAEPDSTIRAIMGAAYRLRRAALHGRLDPARRRRRGDRASNRRLTAAIERMVVADTSANPAAGMGPVIDAAAKQRRRDYIERGKARRSARRPREPARRAATAASLFGRRCWPTPARDSAVGPGRNLWPGADDARTAAIWTKQSPGPTARPTATAR